MHRRDSFDGQTPCEEVVASGDGIQFAMPFGGDFVFDLKVSGDLLAGTLHSKPGVPAAPFNTIELRRTGDLSISDRFPRLDWELGDRSPELRKSVAEGQPGAVAESWTKVQNSGAPVVEPVTGSEASVLATFVWKGKPETKNVLLLWPRLSYARSDDYFFSHIPGTDIWFETLKGVRVSKVG